MDYKQKYLKYKSKYFNLQEQLGGQQKLIVVNGKNFQGADILMINIYKGEDTIVLYEQQYLQKPGFFYAQLAGGRCETSHKSLEDTISSELYEESKKSINISKELFIDMIKTNKFVDYEGDKNGLLGSRRCYICRVPFISKTIFDNNNTILNHLLNISNPKFHNNQGKLNELKKKLSKYMETYNMIRIPIKNIRDSIKTDNRMTGRVIKDNNGIDRHIASYVIKAFKMADRIGLDNLINKPYILQSACAEQNNNFTYIDEKVRLQGTENVYK